MSIPPYDYEGSRSGVAESNFNVRKSCESMLRPAVQGGVQVFSSVVDSRNTIISSCFAAMIQ